MVPPEIAKLPGVSNPFAGLRAAAIRRLGTSSVASEGTFMNQVSASDEIERFKARVKECDPKLYWHLEEAALEHQDGVVYINVAMADYVRRRFAQRLEEIAGEF
jgi:hypothetical protein